MNIIQIFPVIIFMTHEALCQKDPRFLNPHRNQFYENLVVHEPVRRVPQNVPRFEFSFDGLLSSLTAPFRQTLFPPREFPLIKRFQYPELLDGIAHAISIPQLSCNLVKSPFTILKQQR